MVIIHHAESAHAALPTSTPYSFFIMTFPRDIAKVKVCQSDWGR